MFMNSLKALAFAAGFASMGVAAQAATVASISAEADYSLASDGIITEILVDGEFEAFLDLGFDTSAVNDFQFELDASATGLGSISLSETVEDTTGDAIIGVVLSFIGGLDPSIVAVLGEVLDEVLDGDLATSEILPGINFGFDFDITDILPDGTGLGTFSLVLNDGDFLTTPFVLASGEASLNGTISTVSPVPLPATLPLLAFGGMGLFALGRRRKSMS